MELSIIRRETTGAAPNQYNESETLVRFEVCFHYSQINFINILIASRLWMAHHQEEKLSQSDYSSVASI